METKKQEYFNKCKREVTRYLQSGQYERILQYIGHYSYKRQDKLKTAAHLESMLEHIRTLQSDVMELHMKIRLMEEQWKTLQR
jgi:hypothetical protein